MLLSDSAAGFTTRIITDRRRKYKETGRGCSLAAGRSTGKRQKQAGNQGAVKNNNVLFRSYSASL